MSLFLQCSYLPNGYLINKNGEVKSPFGRLLEFSISNSGYFFINIGNKGYFIHRALAFAFLDKIEGKDFVNHKDGIKFNNSIDNLEWCTKGDNLKHAYKLGLKKENVSNLYKGKFGAEHNRSKKVICLETGVEYGSMSEASRKLNISVMGN